MIRVSIIDDRIQPSYSYQYRLILQHLKTMMVGKNMIEKNKKVFWLRLALVNLALVAFFGFLLRTKILFPLDALNYKNLLQTHSYFAFTGWMGLGLSTLLIYHLLPGQVFNKKRYQAILIGIASCSWCIALLFPFFGLKSVAVVFLLLYVLLTHVFAFFFYRDISKHEGSAVVCWLTKASIASLVLSSVSFLLLAWVYLSKSGNSVLYRVANYVFLHFQYNGFFTLSVFSIIAKRLATVNELLGEFKKFAVYFILSIIPSTFLSLLWLGKMAFYIIGSIGALLMLIALGYFFRHLVNHPPEKVFKQRVAINLWKLAGLSFFLKVLMQAGTLVPSLAHAVISDRPVIIGFMHLVFLSFVTFFVLAVLVEEGVLNATSGRRAQVPILVFATGALSTEIILGLQGLGILFQTNSYMYNWLLWGSAILLLVGAILLVVLSVSKTQKKAAI